MIMNDWERNSILIFLCYISTTWVWKCLKSIAITLQLQLNLKSRMEHICSWHQTHINLKLEEISTIRNKINTHSFNEWIEIICFSIESLISWSSKLRLKYFMQLDSHLEILLCSLESTLSFPISNTFPVE